MLRYEQENIEILKFNCNNDKIGESIKRNFEKFTKKDKKITEKRNAIFIDWPTYQTSKLKSMKDFEKSILESQ